eukprot:2027115-Rhodomonas_salina.2
MYTLRPPTSRASGSSVEEASDGVVRARLRHLGGCCGLRQQVVGTRARSAAARCERRLDLAQQRGSRRRERCSAQRALRAGLESAGAGSGTQEHSRLGVIVLDDRKLGRARGSRNGREGSGIQLSMMGASVGIFRRRRGRAMLAVGSVVVLVVGGGFVGVERAVRPLLDAETPAYLLESSRTDAKLLRRLAQRRVKVLPQNLLSQHNRSAQLPTQLSILPPRKYFACASNFRCSLDVSVIACGG